MNAYTWAIGAALIWGMVPIIEKAGLGSVQPVVGVFFRSLGVVLGLLIMGFFMIEPSQFRSVNVRSIVLLMTGGFLASFVAQLTFYHALKLGEVSKIVPISASYPLVTFIIGILMFRENFSLLRCLGVLSIVTGIWAIRIG